MIFSKSEIEQFYLSDYSTDMRLGQAFYDYFRLHRVCDWEGKVIADTIYNLDGVEFQNYIAKFIDYMQ